METLTLIFNILVSLFVNGITTLADRHDKENKKEFDALKKHLEKSNFLQKITVESLKNIHIISKEVDTLKILVSDDIFKKKLSDILLSPSAENDTLNLIVGEIKEYCNLSEDEALSLEPHIKLFVEEFYKHILQNPNLSPFLIDKRIGDSIKISQKEHRKQIELLEKLDKKIDNIDSTIRNISYQNAICEEALPISASTDYPKFDPRFTAIFNNEFEKTLVKLNKIFKSRADEIKQIQKSRDFKKAIDLYKSLLADADEKIDQETILGIYIDCALSLINIGDLAAADNWLSKAEEVTSNDKRALAIRGLYYYELGDKEKSKEFADKSFSLDNRYHLALVLIAGLEAEAGNDGQSILNKYFLQDDNTLKKDFKEEHLAVIYRTIGQCYLKDNNLDNAIASFEKSISLDNFDDATLSLMGFAYLKKALGDDSKVIHFYKKLNHVTEQLVKSAIDNFKKSLEVAARHQNIKQHITRANLALCYMLLEQYDTAYDVANISSVYLGDAEYLIQSKAAAAYHKGLFVEAADLLSKIKDPTCQDIINKALSLLHSAKDNKEREALDLIDEFLSSKIIDHEDVGQLYYQKLAILLYIKDKDKALELLSIIEESELPKWQKAVAKGDFYDTFDDDKKADTYYNAALAQPDIDITTKIYIASHYFQMKYYQICFDICASIPSGDLNTNIDIFRRYLFIAVVSSFEISKYDQCLDYIAYGKKEKIEDVYLNEISASIHWQTDNLEEVRDELLITLKKRQEGKSLDVLTNLGLVSMMLGDFITAVDYFNEAERESKFYDDSQGVINCIVALTILGNSIEARRIFRKCLDMKFEEKDDVIHKFAPVYYLREDNSELFSKYVIAFNNRHGDTEWLWKKDLKEDEEELRNIFSEIVRQSKEIRNFYLNNPMPLALLPQFIGKRELIHLWKFNREYKMPLFLESGNPEELTKETLMVSKAKIILIDYTALLVLMEAGRKYLWILDEIFDEIFIYRPMYLQMLNELMIEEHNELREIVNYLSSSKKIKFIKKSTLLPDERENILLKAIPDLYAEFFYIAKKNKILPLIGELRLRGFAGCMGVQSSGVRAVLEHAKNIDLIDETDLSMAIIRLIKKDSQFISFNKNTFDVLFMSYEKNEFLLIIDKLSNQIFLEHSELETFFDVYLAYINEFFQPTIDEDKICYLIEKSINDIKRLIFRAKVLNRFPYFTNLDKNRYLIDMKELNIVCLRYVYRLLKLINTLQINDQQREKFINIIRNTANLAYWYDNKIENMPIISYIVKAARAKNQNQLLDH